MLGRVLPLPLLLVVSLVGAATAAGCGGKKGVTGGPGGTTGAGGTGGTGNTANGGMDGGGLTLTGLDGGTCSGLDVQPAGMQTITVNIGQMTPTVTFTATLNCSSASPAWGVDKGNVGTVPAGPASSAVFTPTGTTGGVATVSASLNGQTVTRQILVKLAGTQNGPNSSPGETAQIPTTTSQLTSGGGVGGVGGEGLGTTVSDQPTLTALGAPTADGSALGLAFLYPYDQTVWPRGMLAPLLQWTWAPPGGPAAPGDADAIKIDLATTTGSFTWSGTFAKPAILSATGGNFVRMPIPQDVWAMATDTAGGKGDQLKVSLTVAKGGMAYGPISETWTIAPARLDGTIYYNSYGTELSHNYCCDINKNLFGGAVLSIHAGDAAPKLVAGGTLTNPEGDPMSATGDPCRVCHSVAASGSVLVVQNDANRSQGDGYALSPTGNTETPFSAPGGVPVADSTYSAIFPDGSQTLTRSGVLLTIPGGTLAATQPTGLPANPYMPTFSPDGKLLGFNAGAGAKLTVMSFDSATAAFTNAVTVADDTANAGYTPAWPAFFPDSQSMVFHHQSNPGIDGAGPEPCTRGGAEAQIAWTNLAGAGSVTPLDQLNGKGYLPKLPAASTLSCKADGVSVAYQPSTGVNPDLDHSNDVNHNYEPTVLPLGAGGYAWVVFTSRRMYGTVANIPPYCSDPRGVDLSNKVTPKKLWVAAVDLNQAPGTDSSHPAFYLPGQELLAGNSRGFWVLDPCRMDGSSCTSGDQCCNGFCEPGDGGLFCGTPPTNTCSAVGDKCTTAADCCDSTNVCLNGFCAVNQPQ